MGLTIFQVDAFTDRPFAGNPAGVCVLPGAREEELSNKFNVRFKPPNPLIRCYTMEL